MKHYRGLVQLHAMTAVQTDRFVEQIISLFFMKEQFRQFFCILICAAEYDGVRVDFSDFLFHLQLPEYLTLARKIIRESVKWSLISDAKNRNLPDLEHHYL